MRQQVIQLLGVVRANRALVGPPTLMHVQVFIEVATVQEPLEAYRALEGIGLIALKHKT